MTVELHYQFSVRCDMYEAKTCQYDTRGWDANEIKAHLTWHEWKSVKVVGYDENNIPQYKVVDLQVSGKHACPDCVKLLVQLKADGS